MPDCAAASARITMAAAVGCFHNAVVEDRTKIIQVSLATEQEGSSVHYISS